MSETKKNRKRKCGRTLHSKLDSKEITSRCTWQGFSNTIIFAHFYLPTQQTHALRTRFDIIWTCASTLFICTWVAIHPNVPRDEGPIRSLGRRIKLMLWTLLVPELILIWAYRQWSAARYYAKLYKRELDILFWSAKSLLRSFRGRMDCSTWSFSHNGRIQACSSNRWSIAGWWILLQGSTYAARRWF